MAGTDDPKNRSTAPTGVGILDRGDAETDPTIVSGDEGSTTKAQVVVRTGRAANELTFGTVNPQRYRVGHELARGGMGRIFAAHDLHLQRPVAIKELLTASGDLRVRFEREARITARLQHPSIVNLLETGTWPSGEPFYVMKLIAGESLDKAIAARHTLAERLGLVPNVIAAIDALAYAHRQSVIHRDIKPANVLVGEYGETVVIDWGLAKDLADPRSNDIADPEAGPYRASQPGIGMTKIGDVVGTPAYMPLEQAQGELVDARADVYALGALLYHVLAGVPPYGGASMNETLAELLAGPPAPLADRAPGAPADLVAIVAKAMQRAPAERYATAKELADDLKRFQTGQLVGAYDYTIWHLLRRWLRRYRAPVAVAAAAIVLLGVFGVLSVRRIVREQTRAEQNRRDAEELMTFMLGNLREKLEPLGKTPLLREVATKAVAYFDRKQDDLSDADRASRAAAQTDLGDVLAAEGNTAEALEQYRAALAIYEALVAADPTNANRRRGVAMSHDKLGTMLRARGDVRSALAEQRAAMTIREALLAADPTNPARRRDLSVSHQRVGDLLLAQGDAARGLAEYKAAMAIDEALAAADPTNAERQRDLSISYEKLGNMMLAQGDATGALSEQRAALAIREALAAADPTNADRRRDLSISHNKVGVVLFARGDAAGALAEYRAGLTIREALAAADPTNADRRHDLSVSHIKVGAVLLAQGDAAGALADFRAALAIDEALVAADATNAERRRDLSVSRDSVGDALLAQRDTVGALAEYRAAMAIDEALAAADPTNADRRRDLSISHEKVGDVMLAQGDAAGALGEQRAAAAIREALAAADPTKTDRQQDLAESYEKIADALSAQGKLADALAEYDKGQAIAHRLVLKDPTNADFRRLADELAKKLNTCCGK